VIGFTAYVWLLQVTSTARVATHAYVNPVIAVVLGIFVGGETLSTHAAAGGALVVLAVVLILRVPKDSAQSRVLTSSSLSLARPPVPSAADR
jgi:drug/metabolite transporter (DMT)-like permease